MAYNPNLYMPNSYNYGFQQQNMQPMPYNSGYSGYSGGSGGSSGYGYRRGYEGGSHGYGNRSGWANQYGRGYSRRNSMGYADSVEGIRNIMMNASPEEKERMKAEMRSMLEM